MRFVRRSPKLKHFRLHLLIQNKGPSAAVGHSTGLGFNVLDFTQATDPQTAALEWMQSDFDTPNNLQQGPLFSFALIQLTPHQFYFYQSFHHLVCDGYSIHRCALRVAEIYSARIDGNIPAPANFGTFADALAVENVYATSNQFPRDRQHWMDMLAETPEPVTIAGQYAPCCDVIRRQTYLPDVTTQSLRELAHQYQATIPQLLTTLSAIYLHRMTGQEDLLVGFSMAARMNAILRNTPNMSSNILPLRLTMTGDTTLAACLLQAQRQMRSAMRHQSYRGSFVC
ncbi:condensation domain-containing protein [Vibrio sp. PP-XX7]